MSGDRMTAAKVATRIRAPASSAWRPARR